MQYASDFHLHSKYSRAVSRDMVLSTMAHFARLKGLDIITASDWTHPLWFKEISAQLEEVGEGVYRLKSQISRPKVDQPLAEKPVHFILSTEISSIYSQGGRVRRIHNLVFAPNLETAAKINKKLFERGCNLLADGRPIIGLSSRALLELILEVDELAFLIPCHVWTPHFGIYGSASGFDSLEEAFGDLSSYIYGIETGLSSDPEMNWMMPELENRSILSFSDAHSPLKMGREATVFELEALSFPNIKRAIRKSRQTTLSFLKDKKKVEPAKNKVLYTMEFYPEEGKYHYSGHRNCGVVFSPEQTKEKKDICTSCNKKLTEGVFVRVGQLGRMEKAALERKQNAYGLVWHTDKTKQHPPYVKLVPLLEIAAESVLTSTNSQKAKDLYYKLCQELGSELDVLLKSSYEDIERVGGKVVAEGVSKVRRGDIIVEPGYDGVYGVVKIWHNKNEEKKKEEKSGSQIPQMGLF